MASSNSGDDASSLFSFFFYVLFVYPATNWILKPGRFSQSKGLTYAIGLLLAIAAVKTGFEIKERGPNYYQMLDVSRGSSPLDIKRAYKRMSLAVHPDKNPSASAVDEFAKLKDAYDVLMDLELKDVYNRFGEEGVKANKRVDEYRMLLEIAVFYVAWGIMAFMLTLGKASSSARQWVFTGMIVMLVVEVMLMLQELALPDWFLPQTTEHEIVLLLHSLFPAYLNGCRCIGGYLYLDLDEQTRQLLLAVQEQNKHILVALADIQGKLANDPRRPPPAASTPMQKLKEVESTLRAGGLPTVHPANTLLKQQEAAKSSNSSMGLYIMIAGYIALYYCFSGTGTSSS
ncbi:hypothetical protein CTAYLR_008292 [Chrysophaeum taylorii]|uniref:J domain-containing protein n=1 Tax=Chrysophaeum taylorii TaxID=2483200 RepID=A0AAD7U6E4_9STRA|nr:hypothetical protein CTAYLR_008292 [Chrysophaeum taylorii]